MLRHRLSVLVLSSLAALASVDAAARRGEPVAVAAAGPDTYVLDEEGGLALTSAATGAFGRNVFAVHAPYVATDIAAASAADGSSIAMMAVHRAVGTRFMAWVIVVSGGRQRWVNVTVNGILGGVTAESERRAFVTNAITGDVFSIDLGTEKTSFLSALPRPDSSPIVGALAVDRRRGRLLASDYEGNIYEVDLASRKARLFATCAHAEIRALTIDDRGSSLLIADADGESIRRIDLDRPGRPSCDTVAGYDGLSEPAGIAFDASDRVVVADKRARQLVYFGWNNRTAAPPQRVAW